MVRVRLACVGGFLGAGKTTALLAAARELISRGLRVGVITNDQGQYLVDTAFLCDQGLITEEIAGGCFCCRFNDLLSTARRIMSQDLPDIILAEAVGSCTDLSATVYQPLRRYHPDEFTLAPLSILVEPSRLSSFFGSTTSSWPSSVAYLFEKQLDEADVILINKTDLVNAEQLESLTQTLQNRFKTVPVRRLSARAASGIEEWVDLLMSDERAGTRLLEIDYQTYAQAEAALGWLNASITLTSSQEFSVRGVAESLIKSFRQRCDERGFGIAHLKMWVSASGRSDRLSITDNRQEPMWSQGAELASVFDAKLTLNARVNASPEELQTILQADLDSKARERQLRFSVQHLESFQPLPPKPLHRFQAFA